MDYMTEEKECKIAASAGPAAAEQDWETRFRAVIDAVCEEKGRMDQLLNPKYEDCSFAEQYLSMSFGIEEWELNPRGELHGGAIAAMFDLALGLSASCTSSSRSLATTDIAVSYLCRVKADDRVNIKCRIQKSGKRMIRITAEAFSLKSGATVATAQGSYMII